MTSMRSAGIVGEEADGDAQAEPEPLAQVADL